MLDAAPDDRARAELIAVDEHLEDAVEHFHQGDPEPFLALHRASQQRPGRTRPR